MDILTVIGFVSGAACVYFVMAKAGIASLFWNIDAFILVYGGAASCVLITYPWSMVRRIFPAVRFVIFPQKSETPDQTILKLVRLSELGKRGGMDALEAELPKLDDRFLGDGLRMIVDGLPPELIRENLEKEIAFTRLRHQQIANVFKTLGTYSPIFGLLGTLIGVVQILTNLTDPQSLGHSMAIAVTATFYGIFGTNFIFLPVAGKLSAHSDSELLTKEVIIEGVLSVQAKEVPALVSLKLQAFMSYRLRTEGPGAKPPRPELAVT
jgi:chemotaxis protein MotA